MSLHCRQSLHWRLGTHRNHLLGTHLKQNREMRIRRTSCTSRLACRQEHISHWQPFYTGVWARWSTAGGGCCDTAAFLAASEHGDSFVQEQHCTVVLEHSGTAAWAHCCTVALALPGIVVEAPASEQSGTLVLEFQNISVPQPFSVRFHTVVLEPWNIVASARWSTAPRELAGNSAEELENILALVRHCTVRVVHP